MANLSCEQCNKSLGLATGQRYCSLKCYGAARHARKEAFWTTSKPCEMCGTLFSPIPGRQPSEFKRKRFCSRQCRGLEHRNRIDRVLEQILVDQTSGCHIWTGMRLRSGYGMTRLDNRWILVHRAVWEHRRGPIPEGMQLDHVCRTRLCCNVDHLRVVTPRENALAENSRGISARYYRREKCPLCGGPFTVGPDGYRYCKPCRHHNLMAYQRRYRAAKRKEKYDRHA